MVTLPHQQRKYQLFGTPGFFPCILSIFHCFPGHLEVYPLFGLSENDGNYSKIHWTMIFKLTVKTDPHFQRTEVGDGYLKRKTMKYHPGFTILKTHTLGFQTQFSQGNPATPTNPKPGFRTHSPLPAPSLGLETKWCTRMSQSLAQLGLGQNVGNGVNNLG